MQLRRELGRCGGSGCLAQAWPAQEGERGRASGLAGGLGWCAGAGEKKAMGQKKGKEGEEKKNFFSFSKYIFQSHFQVEFEFSNSSQSQSLQKQMCSSMNASTCY